MGTELFYFERNDEHNSIHYSSELKTKKPVEYYKIFNGLLYNLVAMQGIEPRTLRI